MSTRTVHHSTAHGCNRSGSCACGQVYGVVCFALCSAVVQVLCRKPETQKWYTSVLAASSS